jgi:hypothetical protein
VPVALEAEDFLLGLVIVFFFKAVFAFGGFVADVLRTDFFEAINNPFYNNQRFWEFSNCGAFQKTKK